MRKAAGLLLAVSLLVSVGVLGAGSVGAATNGACTSISGSATFTPPLPILTSKATVTTTVKIVSNLSGCSGPGGASGVATSTTKLTQENCSAFSNPKTASKPATQNIVWATKKTSVASATLKPNGKLLQSTLSSTITSGLYKGSHTTATLLGTLLNGGCVSKPLAKLTFKSIGKVVTK